MHSRQTLIEARLDRFIQQVLEPSVYRAWRDLAVEQWDAPGEPVPFSSAARAEFESVRLPRAWGGAWGTTWFRGTGTVPESWAEHDGSLPAGTRAELVVDLGFTADRPGFQAEGLVYRPDGTIVKGIAPRSPFVPLDDQTPGARIDLLVEAAANPDIAGDYDFLPTPYGSADAPREPLYTARRFVVALLDVEAWGLARDIWSLRGLMLELPADSTRCHRLLRDLERMLDAVDPEDVASTAAAGRRALAPSLASPANASSHKVFAVGHAHIDSAWLWPVRETIRKCARTFSNVLQLMDDYPDFVFACSSAQQLAWMKQHYPDLFARIAQRVAEGRFLPVGGMWVEPDINMPGGESMVRQLLLGKGFFMEEFGVETVDAWLPDTFGYSAALPQILLAAGNRWFMSQKISWNQVNTIPHHTFWWEGIDGSRIFAHFPPADTYISELSGAELAHAEQSFRDKGAASMSLVPFGWGDGGGGPTRDMVEAAHRTESLEGSPRVRLAAPSEFFEAAHAEYADAPVWRGELYLELHRGTLTSQHLTKLGNRRSERLLREAELWCSYATIRAGAPYPSARLRALWQTVLLHQFHDILPGCSIAWVHREVEAANAAVHAELEQLIGRAVEALAGEGDLELVANARPSDDAGVAPFAIGVPDAAAGGVTVTRDAGGLTLGNEHLQVTIDGRGLLVSLVARATGREAFAPGLPGNLLQLHRDRPNKWDAWDIDQHYTHSTIDLADVEAIDLDVRDDAVEVVVSRRFRASHVRQRIILRAGARGLELIQDIDWHEQNHLLKLAFPFDVHAEQSTSETQFGHLQRPTHQNTSWDAARFEICAHRWVHVAEPGYGIALANESTYGYDVTRDTRADGATVTTVRATLLRGPRFPDPDSDQGHHVLQFELVPAATIRDAVDAGYRQNLPRRSIRGARQVEPLLRVSNPAVRIEAVKLAEDGSGDLVVRCYESEGGRAEAVVEVEGGPYRITRTDLLERGDGSASTEGTGVVLRLRPFQIATLRLSRLAEASRPTEPAVE